MKQHVRKVKVALFGVTLWFGLVLFASGLRAYKPYRIDRWGEEVHGYLEKKGDKEEIKDSAKQMES